MENKDRINQNQVADEDQKWMDQKNRNKNVQEEVTKKHGDKDAEGKAGSDSDTHKEKKNNQLSDEERFGLDAEFADPNETDQDYLTQPQPMSDKLRSIYAGAAGTEEDRQKLAEERKHDHETDERRKDLGQAGYSEANDEPKIKRFLDTERGNYAGHEDYQDRQGRQADGKLEEEFPHEERNTYSQAATGKDDEKEPSNITDRDDKDQKRSSSGHETPDFSSSLQNSWDEDATNSERYGETDYDDHEVRRRQDAGQQPWDESDRDEEDA